MKFRVWIAAAALLGLCLQGLAAEGDKDYPAKPVKIVVNVTAGGAADLVARLLAAKLSESLGQAFIVENRPGATGNIGTELVARAEPDGYTLLFTWDGPIVINPSFFAKLPLDPVKDLAPVTLATSIALFLLAAPSFPPNSVQELIALAKANPGKFNFASIGPGSQHHLAGELLNKLAGIKLVHIPYKGFGPTALEVAAGRVEIMFGGVPPSVALVKSGKLKALAVTSSKRYAGLPQVPTMIESGLPSFEVYAWFGLMAPARTPRSIIDKLHAEAAKALRSKEAAERLTQSMDVIAAGPQEFAERIASDTRMWARVIKESGAKADD
ncbi:MAG: tripartite tricarboxylate transporter substrate binding protein [Betaproteobacteria bacterium]|nr:MAG: tripartite tricarboxylate transporter substrate binding protein [Betaproteobacteria bacterium]